MKEQNIKDNIKSHSDVFDKFLCEILSKRCNQFISTYNTPRNRAIYQYNQSIKQGKNNLRTLNTNLMTQTINYSQAQTHNRNYNINMNSNFGSNKASFISTHSGALQLSENISIQNQPTQLLTINKDNKTREILQITKQQQMFSELIDYIVQNIRKKLEQIVHELRDNKNKDVFRSIVRILEQQYRSVNNQLQRIEVYIKKHDLKHILNFQRKCICPSQFVQRIFDSLPIVKDYFYKFQMDAFNNQEIEKLKEFDLIYDLVDIDALIEKRDRQKKEKRNNKKKRKKNRNDSEDTGSLNEQKNMQRQKQIKQQEDIGKIQEKNKKQKEQLSVEQKQVIQYFKKLMVNDDRTGCSISQSWMQYLKQKYKKS